MNQLSDILEELRKAEAAWPFLRPVDWKTLQLDDYPLVVTEPMDLKTAGKKLKARQYKSPASFWRDVNLIWSNCKKFNSDSAEVFRLALEMEDLTKALKASFEDALKKKITSDTPTPTKNVTARVSPSSSKRPHTAISSPAPTAQPTNPDKTLALNTIAAYAYHLSLLRPAYTVAVIRYIAENAPECLKNDTLEPGGTSTTVDSRRGKDPQFSKASHESLKLNLDIGLLYTRYLGVFKHSHGFIRGLIRLSKTVNT